jgi:hypothetical protein
MKKSLPRYLIASDTPKAAEPRTPSSFRTYPRKLLESLCFVAAVGVKTCHALSQVLELQFTGKLIIGKLSEFIGILTANCCTAILRPFQRCFVAVSEVFWELIAPNLMILLLFKSNLKYKIGGFKIEI